MASFGHRKLLPTGSIPDLGDLDAAGLGPVGPASRSRLCDLGPKEEENHNNTVITRATLLSSLSLILLLLLLFLILRILLLLLLLLPLPLLLLVLLLLPLLLPLRLPLLLPVRKVYDFNRYHVVIIVTTIRIITETVIRNMIVVVLAIDAL